MSGSATLFACYAMSVSVAAAAHCIAATAAMNHEGPPSHPENTVVLVHGFADDSRRMQTMASWLRSKGWTVYTPTLTPSWGQIGLDALAGQLDAFINAAIRPGDKFDLVGFSMGGLVCRYYLQRMDGARRVSRLVTLGTPHRGSLWAWTLPNAGCRQMRPGSPFLNDLNNDTVVFQAIKFTSIWTPFDLSIIPSVSSEMPQARNERLNILLHPLLVFDKRSLSAVTTALRE